LEPIVGILDVLRELNSRKLPVVYRDNNHIGSATNGPAEMILGVEIPCHLAAAGIEHNNRTRSSHRLMLWWLINADRDMLGNLLVVYVTKD
jgi:hypothetical protein